MTDLPTCPVCNGTVELTPSGFLTCREHGSEHHRVKADDAGNAAHPEASMSCVISGLCAIESHTWIAPCAKAPTPEQIEEALTDGT